MFTETDGFKHAGKSNRHSQGRPRGELLPDAWLDPGRLETVSQGGVFKGLRHEGCTPHVNHQGATETRLAASVCFEILR